VKVLKRIIFWLLALLAMTLIYRSFLGGLSGSLTLATLLLPGAALMSFGLKYWHCSKSIWRWLHLIYLLLFTLYVEWLGMVVGYWLVFKLQFQAVPKVLVNPVFLWLYMLFFTLLEDRIFKKEEELVEKDSLAPLWFEIISERKRQQVNLRDLFFIESANEQIVLHLSEKSLTSRERISQIAERLPESFIRIHRSYIVNLNCIEAYANGVVTIKDQDLPISRKYREEVDKLLRDQ
tara:strand:+ start:715 stop:1419 length:705 start_codon:yes stop_codon:yes gene_type:complete